MQFRFTISLLKEYFQYVISGIQEKYLRRFDVVKTKLNVDKNC